MGCNNSTAVKVAPIANSNDQDNRKHMITKPELVRTTSADSLNNNTVYDNRLGSATSKGSNRSNDSGFYKADSDNEYAHIITENSDEKLIQEVEKNFQPAGDLDLCLTGVPAPRNISARDKARLEEQRILESLRNEGLISTSKLQARSGLAFEVIEENQVSKRALPARLIAIEKKKKRKKKLTEEDIKEKLERAEQRRKDAEAEKKEKMISLTAKSDINSALDNFMQQQKEILEHVQEKVDTATENREKKLKELQEKQRQREERAAQVRLRKKLHIPTQEEVELANSQIENPVQFSD